MSPLVTSYLRERDVRFSVVSHRPLISFDDAKDILPHDPANMVKGLTFQYAGDRLAIVALRAADRADYKKIADALGEQRAKLKLAEPALVFARLDMEVGGIVPLPINGARVLVDRAVLALGDIVCGSGRNTATLVLAGMDWQRVAAGEPGDYAKAG